MTSLDFQAMLRQEKAKLLRDRSVRKPPTSAVTAAEDSAAAGATDDGSCIEEEEKSRAVYKNGDVSLSAGSPTTSLLFAELAGRPPLDMEKIRVGKTPSIYYAPDFVSQSESDDIMSRLYAKPRWSETGSAERGGEGAVKSSPSGGDWVTLRTRRLQCWGGQPGEDFQPEVLPPWMEALCDALVARGVFAADERPNHVLVNEYQPGQGIMPHTDGPYYVPRTATLSLESDAIMHFSPRLAAAEIGQPGVKTGPESSVVLKARCLVVFAEDAYSRLLHGIDAVNEEVVGGAGGGGDDAAGVGGAPVINLDACAVGDAGVREGDLIKRKLRVSLTFRRVCCGGSKT